MKEEKTIYKASSSFIHIPSLAGLSVTQVQSQSVCYGDLTHAHTCSSPKSRMVNTSWRQRRPPTMSWILPAGYLQRSSHLENLHHSHTFPRSVSGSAVKAAILLLISMSFPRIGISDRFPSDGSCRELRVRNGTDSSGHRLPYCANMNAASHCLISPTESQQRYHWLFSFFSFLHIIVNPQP